MEKTVRTIAKLGNSCCDQYAIGGLREYYSIWKITLEKNNMYNIRKIELVSCNCSKCDISPKFFKNYDELVQKGMHL